MKHLQILKQITTTLTLITLNLLLKTCVKKGLHLFVLALYSNGLLYSSSKQEDFLEEDTKMTSVADMYWK